MSLILLLINTMVRCTPTQSNDIDSCAAYAMYMSKASFCSKLSLSGTLDFIKDCIKDLLETCGHKCLK